jgi:hypothetical protein
MIYLSTVLKTIVKCIHRVKARVISSSVEERALFIFAVVGSSNLTCESSVASTPVLLVGSSWVLSYG